jgi:hypothetical protein
MILSEKPLRTFPDHALDTNHPPAWEGDDHIKSEKAPAQRTVTGGGIGCTVAGCAP